MARKIFIGDIVRTVHGVGKVIDARSWREAIVGMNDYEAREFCEKCQAEVGADFIDDWVEVLVVVGGMRRRFLGKNVTVIKGRNDG